MLETDVVLKLFAIVEELARYMLKGEGDDIVLPVSDKESV